MARRRQLVWQTRVVPTEEFEKDSDGEYVELILPDGPARWTPDGSIWREVPGGFVRATAG